MIRIVHVALQLETGGMERLLVEFARHADRSRFALRFVALGARGPVAEEIERHGWPVTALNVRPGTRPSVVFRLARLFGDERADLVHTHNTKPLLYAGPAARLAGVAGVTHTRHGQRHGATGRQNFLFRLAARCADRVVCVSEDSARLCLREGMARGSVRTVRNGIDTERFRYCGPIEGGPAVFVGRLSPEKDVATLVHAAAVVAQRLPSFRLRVAGVGPCAGELRDLSEAIGVGDRVEFLGEVRDVPALLHGASAFVLPSITEGLPLTVLEAMASGLPVVATSVGGVPEAVIDGETGLLVPARDPRRLAAALLRVCGDHGLAARMGWAGRGCVETLFDVRGMVSRYERLYEEVLRGRSAMAA